MNEVNSLNNQLYTDLPIDELDGRLAVEELEDKMELDCPWFLGCFGGSYTA